MRLAEGFRQFARTAKAADRKTSFTKIALRTEGVFVGDRARKTVECELGCQNSRFGVETQRSFQGGTVSKGLGRTEAGKSQLAVPKTYHQIYILRSMIYFFTFSLKLIL